MQNNKVVKIIKYRNMGLANTHHKRIYPGSDTLHIIYKDGTERILCLTSQVDITNVDYIYEVKNKLTIEEVLFYDEYAL